MAHVHDLVAMARRRTSRGLAGRGGSPPMSGITKSNTVQLLRGLVLCRELSLWDTFEEERLFALTDR